ncbi:S8 family peptidase [Pseudomonas syringae pv. aptata]|uniref:S8 family peptidase n=1 Tax=Pseudomonas syringae TaxID=317 RepID=UPI003F8B338A
MNAGKPLVNPVLRFMREPSPATVKGGGKSAKSIVGARLVTQQEKLSKDVLQIATEQKVVHSGMTHIIAKMFDDSHAPSWTPNDIFGQDSGCRIVAPAHEGYLIEISNDKFSSLATNIKKGKTVNEKVDISRVSEVGLFNSKEALRNNDVSLLWKETQKTPSGGYFNIWLLPFTSLNSRRSVCESLLEIHKKYSLNFGDVEFYPSTPEKRTQKQVDQDQLDLVISEYLKTGYAIASVRLISESALTALVASGSIYRVDPVTAVSLVASPGSGVEPAPPIAINSLPTVLVVDGGVNAASYNHLHTSKINVLVNDAHADIKHGNQVASLICQAHSWNNNRSLPPLNCRFISAQAIAKRGALSSPSLHQLVAYLKTVAKETSEHTKVWNMSFNQEKPSLSKTEVSYLGHEISKIARTFDILPIISIGNVAKLGDRTLCPPADCEAALTVSGRVAKADGTPGPACKDSLKGPAAAGMIKPDLSWFSTLRMIGGVIETGTSFSTPLVSSLAAHTFNNLKHPTPDLVRALLINTAELHGHDNGLGWGTPWTSDSLPWMCEEGSVTLAWTAKIKPGFSYYWNDIPIPPDMIENNKLTGTIALTAIIKPIVSNLTGPNYFSTRLQVALQGTTRTGKTENLLGSMKEHKEKELTAREDLAKWSPIRRHIKLFSSKILGKPTARIHARIFARDLYQFQMSHHSELGDQEVSFVLTFKSNNPNVDIYNGMINELGSEVESAVLEQDINIEI